MANFFLGISSLQSRGIFGDAFGAANSLFSAFALLGVAWSVAMQREELKVAKEDRDNTREILKDQHLNSRLQRFETTFFQLFTAFNSIAESVEASDKYIKNKSSGSGQTSSSSSASDKLAQNLNTISQGRASFENYLSILRRDFEALIGKTEKNGDESAQQGDRLSQEEKINAIVAAYDNFFAVNGDDVGRYFRTLYTTMRFIENAEIPAEQKRFYFKFLRAQLSMHESTFLVLNFLSKFTTPEFNDLCVKYGMAKNADRKHPLIRLYPALPTELFGNTEVELETDYLIDRDKYSLDEFDLYDNDESDGH
ncbi:putative phage abortive infection protein [Rhodobacter sp. KR11]|uniref:putative phage abortive infection protein n=1 Tax=Rhodobacter sp. KR11 TaxID=2974588 RepID=UPI0022218140|nr:putative phage abortive infection protein [Rhodobacter sp. KR11]MCW1920864.1 putative phage abortive infection protein [Rhodobacter sp. KR11]